jgi:polyisoprenoid-binding protein YceI
MNVRRCEAVALSVMLSLGAIASAVATDFTADPNHTFVRFSYNHMGFSTQEQRFNKVTSKVTYDPQAKSASVTVLMDTKSVDTGSDLLNGDIQGADFLDTEHYPTATFRSTSVTFDGDVPVKMEGELTLKGITKPVRLTVGHFKRGQNMMRKDSIGADATGVIKRSDFNMSKYAPAVGDDVMLTISLEGSVP